MSWRLEEIRKSISSWYNTKIQFQDAKAKLSEEDVMKAHQIIKQIDELHIELRKVLWVK